MNPCIMHVDIDAFFASVEQVCNPKLRGKPVIVGSGVIASCSYEARRYGLYAGMPLRDAVRLCPGAYVLEGHQPTYRCYSARIFELCREISPTVETYLDEAYCDLSGTDYLYASPADAGRILRERIHAETGITATVGIGSNRMIAKMAGSSAKPDGIAVVEEGDEEAFIASLPVEKLPGVGHATRAVLGKFNITTIAELKEIPRSSLEALFPTYGLALYERARGRDTRVIHPREIPKSISRETTFHSDTIETDEIEAMLYYLVERAARSMRTLGLKCKTLNVRIRYSDFTGEAMTRSFPFPTAIDKELFELARDILQRIFTRRVSLRFVGVTLANFSCDTGHQIGLFGEKETQKQANLCRVLDTLRRRYGHSVVLVGKSLNLMNKLDRDTYGYILRTPCLTK